MALKPININLNFQVSLFAHMCAALKRVITIQTTSPWVWRMSSLRTTSISPQERNHQPANRTVAWSVTTWLAQMSVGSNSGRHSRLYVTQCFVGKIRMSILMIVVIVNYWYATLAGLFCYHVYAYPPQPSHTRVKSHSLSTRRVRTACSQLSTCLKQVVFIL